ncbi:MAG: hypothetical protein JXR40_05995 [Pontiellaceae bacterium]|nr:hypothetical protein [Pontiellaceae bacterium]
MRLFNHLVDLINPVVLRESRQLVRSRFAVGILMLFLLIMVVVSATFAVEIRSHIQFSHGKTLFSSLYAILTVAAILFIPAHTALPMIIQKQSAGMDLLFISTIPPRSIILGKMASAFWMMILMFSVSMPFMILTTQLRGIGLFEVLSSLALLAGIVMTATMGFLLLACLPASRVFLSLLSIGYMYLIVVFSMQIFMGLRFSGSGIDATVIWSALGIAAILLCIGGAMTTALISPPISNRSLAVRITITICWIIAGIVAALPKVDLMEVWMGLSCMGAAAAIITTSSEPSKMSRRVQRSVPRNPLLRILCFPFFTGALNGMLWALGIGLISVLLGDDMQAEFAAFFLYMLMYSLLAIRIRTLPTVAKRVREKYTWAIALILVAFGSIAPVITYFMIDSGGSTEQMWGIGNPFAALFGDDAEIHILFCLFSSLVLIMANIVWFLHQISGFRPVKNGIEKN